MTTRSWRSTWSRRPHDERARSSTTCCPATPVRRRGAPGSRSSCAGSTACCATRRRPHGWSTTPGPSSTGRGPTCDRATCSPPGGGRTTGPGGRQGTSTSRRSREGAPLAAELARGDGPGRVYRVEPLGTIEDDPNVTDKRFPGNPTRSYRTTEPLRVVEEVTGWDPPPPRRRPAPARADGRAGRARHRGDGRLTATRSRTPQPASPAAARALGMGPRPGAHFSA